MFQKSKIQEILHQAAQEKWAYPRVFEALKEAGVACYETKVAEHKITYYGEGKKEFFVEKAPAGFQRLTVAPRFDAEGIRAVLHHHQTEKTTYQEFLKGIAAAGVPAYRVDMIERTVSYVGSQPHEKIVEKVPVFNGS